MNQAYTPVSLTEDFVNVAYLLSPQDSRDAVALLLKRVQPTQRCQLGWNTSVATMDKAWREAQKVCGVER